VLALSPIIGASAAASLGFLGAFFGGLPPSTVAGIVAPWSALQNVTVLLWNVLPLPWRAARWLTGNTGDGAVLLAWVVFGVGAAALMSARQQRGGGSPPAGAR
jgi:hypothetical protein